MKLIEFLKKYVGPGIITAVTLDSYRRQVSTHNKELTSMQLKNENNLKEIQTKMWEDTIVRETEAIKLKSINAYIEELDSKIKTIENKLALPNNSDQYKEYLNKILYIAILLWFNF